MNGLLQFIRFVIDRGSVQTATTQAQQVGQQIGQAASKGAQSTSGGITTAITNALGKARQAVNNFTDAIQNRFDALRQAGIDAFTKAFPLTAAILIERAIERVAEKVKELATELIKSAADAQRIGIEFDAVFGNMAEKADAAAMSFGRLFGASRNDMREMLTHIQGMGVGLGFTREQAADLSIGLAKIAGDVSAYWGIPMERAMHAVQGGMVGLTRPLHLLGIMLRQETIEQQAFAETGKKSASALTEQEKALAAYHAMLRLSAPMTGAAARNSDTLGKTWERFTAILKDARDQVGVELIPVLTSLGQWIASNSDRIKDFAIQGFRLLGGTIVEVVSALRILIDISDAVGYGLASSFEMATGALLKLLSYIPVLGKGLDEVADKFFNAAFVDAEKGTAALKDVMKAWHDMANPLGDGKLPHHPAGGMPGAAPPPKGEANWLEKELKAIKEGVAMSETRNESLRKAEALESKLLGLLRNGNLSFEDRVKYHNAIKEIHQAVLSQYDQELAAIKNVASLENTRHEVITRLQTLIANLQNMQLKGDDAELQRALRLHEAYKALAEAKYGGLSKDLQHTEALEKSGLKLLELLRERKRLNDLRATAKTAEDVDELDRIGKSLSSAMKEFDLAESLAGVFEAGITGAESFSTGLKMLADDARTVQRVLMVMGKGSAKALLAELRDIARAKVLENVAWGLEDLGHFFFSPVTHPGALKAAESHFEAAAAWGLVAGAAGAGARGGGGGAGGASAPDRAGGDASDSAKELPTQFIFYIDGIDPDNPMHQDLAYDLMRQAVERNDDSPFTVSVKPASAASQGTY